LQRATKWDKNQIGLEFFSILFY